MLVSVVLCVCKSLVVNIRGILQPISIYAAVACDDPAVTQRDLTALHCTANNMGV